MPIDVIHTDDGWRFDEGHFFDEPPTVVLSAPTTPEPKKKGKTMDYIPKQRDARYLWYKNLSTNIVAEAVKMGAPAADGTAAKAAADAIIAKYDATNTADAALTSARQLEKTVEATNLALIRAKVKNWKTLAGFPTSGSEGVLGLRGSDAAFDPVSYKPGFKVSTVVGGVRIDFVKKGVDGVNIYMRVHGTAAFRKIGMDTESPYTDSTPLAVAGAPEVRDYMLRGVLHDEEIGVNSDVASATFEG